MRPNDNHPSASSISLLLISMITIKVRKSRPTRFQWGNRRQPSGCGICRNHSLSHIVTPASPFVSHACAIITIINRISKRNRTAQTATEKCVQSPSGYIESRVSGRLFLTALWLSILSITVESRRWRRNDTTTTTTSSVFAPCRASHG